jgi:hypothetical protein
VTRALVVVALLCGLAHAADDQGYELVQAPPASIKAGKKATLSLTVLPHGGYRLLADGPVELRLTGEGVKLPRPALHREDVVDARAEAPRFELPLVAERPGPAAVSAECTFYLCREARCRPVTTTVRWTLTITP